MSIERIIPYYVDSQVLSTYIINLLRVTHFWFSEEERKLGSFEDTEESAKRAYPPTKYA